jgi:ribosomal protein S18 acetylase RimI-like enzyme
VHPGHRGRGVARALITDLLARVRRITDLRQVSLTVATTQLTATGLYESIGFKRFGLESRSLLIGDVFVDEEHRVFMLDASSAPQ